MKLPRTLLNGLTNKAIRRPQERIRLLEERILLLEQSILTERSSEIEHLANLLRPVSNGHRFSRFGAKGDGGYVLPTDLGVPDFVISIGVGSECSADDDLADFGAKVIQFDHTVTRSPAKNRNVVFHPVGLSGGAPGPETRPLVDLLEIARVNPVDTSWLMLDAEGVEWDLLVDATAPLGRFSVINIEFHCLSWMHAENKRSDSMTCGIERLRTVCVPIAWHANNYAPVSAIGGRWVPDVLEVTFVRKSDFKHGDRLGFKEFMHPNNPYADECPVPFSDVADNPYQG